MSATTACEGLPYPCLSDLQQRHYIQDLATSADFVLNRIGSDVNLVNQRAKAQARRMNSDQAMVANVFTNVTYDTVDFQPTAPLFTWVTAASGTIQPSLAGVYFVDGRVSHGSPTGAAYILEIQYNGVTIMSRKFDTAAGGGLFEIQGISGLAVVTLPEPIGNAYFMMRFKPITAASVIRRARFSVQWLGRCNPPINANPYFEKDISNWTALALSTIAWSTVSKYRGNASMRVTPLAAAWSVGSELFPVTVGVTYQAAAFTRGALANVNMHIELRWYTAANVFISTSAGAVSTALTSQFTLFNVTAVAPATAAKGQLVIKEDSSGTQQVYIDDAYVYRACGN